MWMHPKLSALRQSIAGQVMLAIFESGGGMSGHGWLQIPFQVVAMRIEVFFSKYHMRAMAQHAFIRAMGFPTFHQSCAPPGLGPQ